MNMNNYAFEIFGIGIAWYGIILAGAMVIGSLLLIRFSQKLGYEKDDMYDLILWVLPMAVLGARLYYVAFKWEYYSQDWAKILAFREGGLAIHGGIIGGLIGGYICCKLKKLNFADLADLVSMPLILGQAIGRWGNFANGEAHGGPTNLPWAIEVGGVHVHPTFLYESIWNLIVFAILLATFKKRKYYGEHFLMYMALYSFGRFFIEGLRTDSLMFMGLRTAQLVSVTMIMLSVVLMTWIKKNPNNRIQPRG